MAVRQRRQRNGKSVVKEQRNHVFTVGLMCVECIRAPLAPNHETSAKSVIEVLNPHRGEAATVLADVTSRQALIGKVREHFTDYTDVPVSERRTSLDP